MEDRAQWEYTGVDAWGWDTGTATVSITNKGILIEVEQEHAVDSHNSTFICDCLVPFDQAGPLVEMLNKAMANISGSDDS